MSELLGAIQQNREPVLEDWLRRLKAAVRRQDLINDRELESQIAELLFGDYGCSGRNVP